MGNTPRSRPALPNAAPPDWICEIVVGARLATRWAKQFDGFEVVDAGDGTTVLRGDSCDQSALFGALGRVRDLGVPLLAVRRVPPGSHT